MMSMHKGKGLNYGFVRVLYITVRISVTSLLVLGKVNGVVFTLG